MIPYDLHSEWPKAVYLVPLMLLFLVAFVRLFAYRHALESKLQFATIISRSPVIFWIKTALFCLAWMAAIVALMRPVGNGHYPEGGAVKLNNQNQVPEFRRKAHDIYFLIDTSASMAVKDARQNKSRLEYAKDIADEIASGLTGENAALYAFTAITTELSPASTDYLFLRFMISQIQVNEGGVAGTNLFEAIASMRNKFFSKPTQKLKTLIMFTDGGDTSIEALPAEKQVAALSAITEMISDAKERHLRVYMIGMGTVEGGVVTGVEYQGQQVKSVLEESWLKAIAAKGRGTYYFANAYTPISLAEDINVKMRQDPQYRNEGEEMGEGSPLQSILQGSPLIYTSYFQIPLALAIVLLGIVFLFPDTLSKKSLHIFAVASLVHWHIGADPHLMRQAEIYKEAEMPDRAIEIYTDMLKGELTKEQRNILHYDIATLHLQRGNLESAVQILSDVELTSADSPLLTIKLSRNLAIAHYSLARRIKEETALGRLYHLRLAEAALSQEAAAQCALQSIFGEGRCDIPKDLTSLQSTVDADIQSVLAQAVSEISLDENREEVSLPQSASPQSLLEAIIQRQKSALIASSQSLRNKADVSSSQSIVTLPIKLQKELLQAAEGFRQIVFKQQVEQFQSKGVCQSSPWGSVLTLFEQGENHAREGLYSLEKTPLNLLQAMLFQKKAYEEWKKTLDALMHPKDDSQGGCRKGSSGEREEIDKQDKAPQSQVEQTVQDMFLEDQVTKKELQAIKLGEKPW